jgi:hypothetical protein
MVYSRAERMFTLEHYFVSKSFTAVREAFTNMHPDNEVANETITTTTGNIISGCRNFLSVTSEHRATIGITAAPISSVHQLQQWVKTATVRHFLLVS